MMAHACKGAKVQKWWPTNFDQRFSLRRKVQLYATPISTQLFMDDIIQRKPMRKPDATHDAFKRGSHRHLASPASRAHRTIHGTMGDSSTPRTCRCIVHRLRRVPYFHRKLRVWLDAAERIARASALS